MQYQGQERGDYRMYGQIYDYHFPWQRCDWIFSQFVRDRFSHFFNKGNNQKGKLFLQDEDPPPRNCKISQEAMNKIPYRLFMMPPRSPDLNPIENIFHLVGVFLRKDAIMKKIKRETYKQFCNRVLTQFLTLHQIL